ncbi:hypothetical protein SUNI508_09989 [Seiridium unicorne]|uniref:Uncharacterized protein n=1 Tax=Seiridium unicorne TaxID=138068 RepID=A0ABR2UN65_9PEZI
MLLFHKFALLAPVVTAVPQYWGDSWGLATFTTAVNVGDGNPHQRYHYKQLTHQTDCSDGPCEIAYLDAQSYEIGFSGDLLGADWISGGFSVTQSHQTGNTPNCQSKPDEEQDILCVWFRTAHTAYTVQNWKHDLNQNPTDGDKDGDPHVLTSPNDKNVGHAYVCGRGDRCKEQGAEFWGSSAPAGGPTAYPFKEDWQ